MFFYFLFHSLYFPELFHEGNTNVSPQKIKTLQSLLEVRFFFSFDDNNQPQIKSHHLPTKSMPSHTAAISQEGHTCIQRDSPGVYIPLLSGLPHAHRCARKHTHTVKRKTIFLA